MASQSLNDRLAALVDPLRAELAEIDKELVDTEARVDQLKADRRRLSSVILRVEGTPLTKKRTRDSGQRNTGEWRVSADAVGVVRDYILSGKVDKQNIVATTLAKQMREEKHAAGEASISNEVVRRSVREMHAAGELRLLGKGRAGSSIYAYTGKTGKDADNGSA